MSKNWSGYSPFLTRNESVRQIHAHDSAVNGEWADAKHKVYQGKLLGVAAIQQRVFAVASQSGGSALVALDDGDDAQRHMVTRMAMHRKSGASCSGMTGVCT